jgi:hypothetical protein
VLGMSPTCGSARTVSITLYVYVGISRLWPSYSLLLVDPTIKLSFL